MANDLIVRILGDTKGLERSFARANTSTAQFGRNIEGTGAKIDKTTRSLKGFATGAAAGFGGALAFNEAAKQLQAAITVASNLQEQISKTNVVFGKSADVVEDWSKTTADGIGIARDQALAAASTFGSMFNAAGQSAADAAGLSKAVVQLGADLASFNNTSVDDALTALRSGLSGEIEPLRRFQVFLTEAAVANEAMAQSGKNSAKELTQGEKIMARWSLILKQTTAQQGDFARTSEGLANQQRKLAAQTRDLQAALGTVLLPTITEVVTALNEGATAALDFADALKGLGNARIPGIDIPINFTFPGTNTTVGGGIKDGLKKALRVQFFGPLGIALNAKDLFDGDEATNPNTNAAAKNFEDRFSGFLGSLGKAADKGLKESSSAATKVAAFGEKGFKPLTKSLKQVREERAKAQAEADAIAQERRDTAAAKLLAGLSLGIDRAELTSGLRDDVVALEAMKTGLQRLIARGQDVQENQARLVATIGQIAAKRQEIAERAKAALQASRQASQFRQIGLTAEGSEVIPGVDNLRKQFESLSQRLVGSDVPRKLQDRMRLVGKFLAKGAKDATVETRTAIRDLFREIRGTFDSEKKDITGPLTKTSSLNANKVLEGLGLGPDMERELRARLSSFNSAGKALAGGGNRPTGSFVVGSGAPVQVETTVVLDGEVVGRSVRKSNQKNARRNPRQKSGPNARSGV